MKHLILFFLVFLIIQNTNAQFGFSHEIGVIAGPIEFRSDFGNRNDSETNFGNSGYGVGIVHYLNFAYQQDCNCYTTDNFFNDHFKLRNEISYNKTNLEHLGFFVSENKTSDNADRLRGHKGVAENLDIGMQLEFFPLSIRDFQGFSYRFAPFVSLGVHYTSFSPEVSTSYINPDPTRTGDLADPSNFYSFWEPGSIDASPGNVFSLVSSIGLRYKLGKLSDLMLDLRWQYFFNDNVDGLNHQLRFNRNDDWLVWLNFGYIVYLD